MRRRVGFGMTFFQLGDVQAAAERVRLATNESRRKIKIKYCGNCQREQEHIYLWYHDVPFEYVGTRICIICGFAPGRNIGVKNKELRRMVLEADRYECVYCGATEKLVIDHIIPHANGGKSVFENLLTACRSCNSARNTKRTPVLRYGRFRKT